MRYLMLIRCPETFQIDDVPQSLLAAMGEFIAAATKNGSLVDTAGLQPMARGKRVRLSGGKITVTDGPFAEMKEAIGGYALIEARSDDEALAVARRFMDLHRLHWPSFEGECELRPLLQEEQPAQ